MNAADALARLRALGVPIVSTVEAAHVLGESVGAASKTLGRLAHVSLVRRVVHGLWAITDDLQPYVVPEYVTAPLPSYVSLQTAMHVHGLIEQIPAIVYVVSLARARTVRTSVGTFSIHRVAPEVFGGFELDEHGAKVAQPEKALFDLLYLSATRDRTFASVPEIHLPRRFRRKHVDDWIRRITSPRLAQRVTRRWKALAARAAA